MIIVRPFADKDRPAIETLHAQMGLNYEQPDWGKMLVSAVVEADEKITMAAFLRMTAESYLLFDPESGRRRDKLGQLMILHRELLQPAMRRGIEDVHCWLPPQIEQNFGKLLMNSFGWKKPLWPCYSREIK